MVPLTRAVHRAEFSGIPEERGAEGVNREPAGTCDPALVPRNWLKTQQIYTASEIHTVYVSDCSHGVTG